MFYPAHLNLDQQPCLVIGSGLYAERRVISLYRCGAKVTWVGIESTSRLEILVQKGLINFQKWEDVFENLAGSYLLVFIDTGDRSLNSELFQQAHHIPLINTHDVVPESTFAATSLVNTTQLTISVSTGGYSPALSRYIRQYIERLVGLDAINHLEETNTIDSFPYHPLENSFPLYPVGLILEGRNCWINKQLEQNYNYQQRFDLLQKCGARLIDQPRRDTFLAVTNQKDLTHQKLIEVIGQTSRSRFVTPRLILDGDLIIGMSCREQSSKNVDYMEQIYDQLCEQFTDNSYDKLLELLGSLRPTVSKSFVLSEQRYNFYNDLILRSAWPRSEVEYQFEFRRKTSTLVQDCCLTFGKLNCQTNCLFNAVRYQSFTLSQLKTVISNQISASILDINHHMLIDTNLTHLDCQPDCSFGESICQTSTVSQLEDEINNQKNVSITNFDHHMLIDTNLTRLLYREEQFTIRS